MTNDTENKAGAEKSHTVNDNITKSAHSCGDVDAKTMNQSALKDTEQVLEGGGRHDKCETESVGANTHSSEVNVETDSLNSVGEISIDEQNTSVVSMEAVKVSVTSSDQNSKDSSKCDQNDNNISPRAGSEESINKETSSSGNVSKDSKKVLKSKNSGDKLSVPSDLSKRKSKSNTSLDKAAGSASGKKRGVSAKSTDSDTKRDAAAKKSDSLASKLKSKVTKTVDGMRKHPEPTSSDKAKKSDATDKSKSVKTKTDKVKTEKKTEKKTDKKEKKSDSKVLSSVKAKVTKGSKGESTKSVKTKTQADKTESSKKPSSSVDKKVSNVTETNKSDSTEDIDKSEKDTISETETGSNVHESETGSNETGSVVNEDTQDINNSTEDITEEHCDEDNLDEDPDTDQSDDSAPEAAPTDASQSECTDGKDEQSTNESQTDTKGEQDAEEKANVEEGNLTSEIDAEETEGESHPSEQHEEPGSPGVEMRKKHEKTEGKPRVHHVHDASGQEKEDVDFNMADFGSMSKQAEQRLAARRAAREEARLIRMKELERQQREMEEKQDRIYELTRDSGARGFTSSRRGSDDSTSSEDTRELKKQLAEIEEKYKKAMMNSAQLDNEKQKFRYEVDILKDKYEEIEESHIEITRQHRDRCKELEQKKRDLNDLQIESEYLKLQITQRDKLIQEYGLVFVSNETVEEEDDKKQKPKNRRRRKKEEQEKDQAALVTPDALTILGKVNGNLDERLKHFADNNQKMEDEIKKLRIELDEERAKNVLSEKYNSPKSHRDSAMNGPTTDGAAHEANMEAQKQLTEYRYKLKKAEQDITVLEGNVIRLESQVKRYKGSSDESEKTIEDMKQEKRKLTRDLRDAQYRVEELNSQNQNLQTRIKTLKQERIDSIIAGK